MIMSGNERGMGMAVPGSVSAGPYLPYDILGMASGPE